jgi:phosphonoacetaldehyde hydrolase
MCYRNAIDLKVYPLEAIVKIGNTITDVEEGLNAGMWTIGVAGTGNFVGLSEREWHALGAGSRQAKLAEGRQKLLDAGAHYVIDNVSEFDPVVDELEGRLKLRERP